MQKRDMLFCCYYHLMRTGREAAVKAGYPTQTAEKEAEKLLGRQDIQKEIQRMGSEWTPETLRQAVVGGLVRLALGVPGEKIGLLAGEREEVEDAISQLDLFHVSEIKRSGSTIDIKFHDRLAAMNRLMELCGQGGGGDSLQQLCKALEQAAGKDA